MSGRCLVVNLRDLQVDLYGPFGPYAHCVCKIRNSVIELMSVVFYRKQCSDLHTSGN